MFNLTMTKKHKPVKNAYASHNASLCPVHFRNRITSKAQIKQV